MKTKPLQPASLTSVLLDIAELQEDAFVRLANEIDGPDAFDAEKERIATLAPLIGVDDETATALVSAIGFLYQRIHRDDSASLDLPSIVKEMLESLVGQEEVPQAERPNEIQSDLIIKRLSHLLRRQDNVDKFAKHERLRWGFLPAATGFATFVDLRPNLSDDLSAVEELIPVIQFRVRTDSSAPMLKNFVFQLDPRNLKRLKAEIERAERKLNTIMANQTLSGMIAKRRS